MAEEASSAAGRDTVAHATAFVDHAIELNDALSVCLHAYPCIYRIFNHECFIQMRLTCVSMDRTDCDCQLC
jgi:hypothetical protein